MTSDIKTDQRYFKNSLERKQRKGSLESNQNSVMILFPHANRLPLFQHGRCPSRSGMFQKHAFACFFLLAPIYYLHAFHAMLTIPIPRLSPYAQRSYIMSIPHYLHIVHHMNSMLILHYLHTHTICFLYFDHAFPYYINDCRTVLFGS